MQQNIIIHKDSERELFTNWVKNLIDDAKLPHLYKPTMWTTTENKHSKIVYEPVTKKTVDLDTGEEKIHKTSPVGFIPAPSKMTMPGTKTPAAVRLELYLDNDFQKFRVEDALGNNLIPCFAHGDYVKVESLQGDHMQSKDKIKARQLQLVEFLNKDEEFAKFVMSLSGMDKFFIKTKLNTDKEFRYYGTLLYYEIYFNAIDNIWLICQACNLEKGNRNTKEWLEKKWPFRKRFIEFLGDEDNAHLLAKSKDNQGLAQVAIKWFWKYHANYMVHCKIMQEGIIKPLQILNFQIDFKRGEGRLEEAEQLDASLTLREIVIGAVADMPGLEIASSAQSSKPGKSLLQLHDQSGAPISVTKQEIQRVDADIRKGVKEAVPAVVGSIV